MFDLIKTFIEGLWIDKKYRYIFLFILITLCYRCVKTSVIYTQEEITPVKFVKMNSDASMELVYLSKEFTLHLNTILKASTCHCGRCSLFALSA